MPPVIGQEQQLGWPNKCPAGSLEAIKNHLHLSFVNVRVQLFQIVTITLPVDLRDRSVSSASAA